MKKLVALLVVIVALAVGIFVLATRHNTPRPISTVTYACDNNMTITAAYYEGPKQPPVPAHRFSRSLPRRRSKHYV